jgi:hypothetical protein
MMPMALSGKSFQSKYRRLTTRHSKVDHLLTELTLESAMLGTLTIKISTVSSALSMHGDSDA